MTKRYLQVLMVLVLLGGASACGSKGSSAQAELASFDEALRQAIALGAEDLAPVELRIAREKHRQAQGAMKKRSYDKAEMLSREAQVDAQLAGALSAAAIARHAVASGYDDSVPSNEAGTEKSSAQRDSLRTLLGG